MAKVFLDTNIFIDFVERKQDETREKLDGHDLFISPLSTHIFMYTTKRKVPDNNINPIIKLFFIVTFDKAILNQSLNGPTADFEDNVQLHSANEAECDFFLTEDKELLNLKFFGKTQILKHPKEFIVQS